MQLLKREKMWAGIRQNHRKIPLEKAPPRFYFFGLSPLDWFEIGIFILGVLAVFLAVLGVFDRPWDPE